MMKKMISLILVFMFSICLCVNALAQNDVPDVFVNKDTQETEQFLVTITRPEGDETTFKESYVLCGNSDKENITVKLLMYNELTGKFEPFKNIDGEDTWQIGASGFFMKEIKLPKKGANKIRIVAYKGSNEKDVVLKPGDNLQVNTFTVTLLEKSVKDSIKRGFLRITDMLNVLFGE
ncbi:MAG TPA: hypothetical protein PK033_05410 [Acetivibrio sp.]|jgi:hypothetical protein|nr:hypothetical protein [Clostridium sp.]HOQ36650.1 hypothetical protein [Acetivibrio sp.]HPT91799.1 hypothetical protein [Acetivibrio sp.]HQA57300.1 hypothetical protein [Acetivibrio sp.]